MAGAAGATDAAQTSAANNMVSPGKVAGAINDAINALTPESLAAMATASTKVADNMGLNTVQLEALNRNLDALNKRLSAGTPSAVERAVRK